MSTSIEFERVSIGGQLVTDDVAEVRVEDKGGYGLVGVFLHGSEMSEGLEGGLRLLKTGSHHVVQVDDQHWSVSSISDIAMDDQGRWLILFGYGDEPEGTEPDGDEPDSAAESGKWGEGSWDKSTWGSAAAEEE